MIKIRNTILSLMAGILFIIAVGFFCKSRISMPVEQGVKQEEKTEIPQKIKIIEVRKGFCLSEITQDLGADWRKVAKLNNIENPDQIFPGQKIKVPLFSKTRIVKVSWYGSKFHGKRMSNGKIFNMNDPSVVAHKWLPFGTEVRLIRTDNNESVVVIVQDRGPYIKGRTFDLSQGAAKLLGMIDDGITTCKVEILN